MNEGFTEEGSFQPGCGGYLGVCWLKGREGTFQVRETAGDASYERPCHVRGTTNIARTTQYCKKLE